MFAYPFLRRLLPSHGKRHPANYDCLFRGSIGRTDLPGGDTETLFRSIKEKLFALPADTRVLSGHGPETEIGHERKHNPFVGEKS